MKRSLLLLATFIAVFTYSMPVHAEREASAEGMERVLFGFEKGTEGWEIPEWASKEKIDAAKSVKCSRDIAKSGQRSLRVNVSFPAAAYAAALVEEFEYCNWTPYRELLCDVYLPKRAPQGLKAIMVLTVGDHWKRVEMSHYVDLVPGKWVTMSADILPGSKDWKTLSIKESFRKDVRKMAVKVVSDKEGQYAGPVYIDDVRLIAQ